MDTSTWIATLSFLVALLAAIYARWASFEAKRSNDLAFHTNKIEIYKEFLVLKYAILQREENISYEDTKKFYFSHLYSEFSSLSKPITKSNSILTPALILRENRSMPQGLMS
jgi:hypothetical protein